MSTKKTDYSDFTLSLAIVDAVPVLLFCVTGILIALRFGSPVFIAGIVFCITAGFGKVLWKLLLALTRADFHFLNTQFRFLMPLGFSFIIASLAISRNLIHWSVLFSAVTGLPQIMFFAAGFAGMCLMAVFAAKRDDSVRSNWIEQGTNSAAQLMILLGVCSIG